MAKTLYINGVRFEELTQPKQIENMQRDFDHAVEQGYEYLHEVYGSYSRAKERAYEDCREIRNRVNGRTMFIYSYCTCFFTLMYEVEYEGQLYIVKETPSHRLIAKALHD